MFIDKYLSIVEVLDAYLTSTSMAFRPDCNASEMMLIIVQIFAALAAFSRISIFKNQNYSFLAINIIRIVAAVVTLWLAIIYASWFTLIQAIVQIGLSIWSIYIAWKHEPEPFIINSNIFYPWIQLVAWAVICVTNITEASCAARPFLTVVTTPVLLFSFCSLCTDVHIFRIDHYSFWVHYFQTGRVKKSPVKALSSEGGNRITRFGVALFALILFLDSIAIGLAAFLFPLFNICPTTTLECSFPPTRSMLVAFNLLLIGIAESSRLGLTLMVS